MRGVTPLLYLLKTNGGRKRGTFSPFGSGRFHHEKADWKVVGTRRGMRSSYTPSSEECGRMGRYWKSQSVLNVYTVWTCKKDERLAENVPLTSPKHSTVHEFGTCFFLRIRKRSCMTPPAASSIDVRSAAIAL